MLWVAAFLAAQNPYMPLWEFIPDGEPYVFADPDQPGKERVYVYGSHDMLRNVYCGKEQVVWSASTDSLDAWRLDGECFRSGDDVLYAPDVALRMSADGTPTYFFYPNNQADGRRSQVAKSHRPDGPFEVCNRSQTDPTQTVGVLGFDPAVFVDDDGRVYGYWGFERSYAAELDPETMCTPLPGTEIIEDMIPSYKQDTLFRFFEASSIRKIDGAYIFIYSRMTREGEFGLPSTNYTLAYAYSSHPLGPWVYGGTLIDGRARDVDAAGQPICTANPYGNTHGSLCQINGKWWLFYHRQTGTDEFSRQAMVAEVKELKVRRSKNSQRLEVRIAEGEYNSEGFRTEGLNPLQPIQAGWACYLTNPDGIRKDYPHFIFSGSYVEATRDAGAAHLAPVVNNTAGSVVGYKYLNFSLLKSKQTALLLHFLSTGVPGRIDVMLDSPYPGKGLLIGSIALDTESRSLDELVLPLNDLRRVHGKHALFFVFRSEAKDKSLGTLYDFHFQPY